MLIKLFSLYLFFIQQFMALSYKLLNILHKSNSLITNLSISLKEIFVGILYFFASVVFKLIIVLTIEFSQ